MSEIKQKQKEIIERFDVEPWVKDEIINVLDVQIAALPWLDRQQYTILINSVEHPNGYKLGLTAHPTIRFREGALVRDVNGNVDSFFWEEDVYEKNKKKSKYYLIGGETGEYLENYVRLRSKIKSEEDGRQLSFKVASRKYPLEVMETPAEQRYGVEVTEELLAELPELVESYNDWDETQTVKLCVGDLLVLDGNGFYYRVEKSLKEQTYHKGSIE